MIAAPPLRAAVVGLGVGAQHAKAFVRTDGAELRWLHDHDPARVTALAAEVGQGEAAASYEAILDDAATDVVSIATYDDDHALQVVAALEHGKHVFCEKPLCHTAAELVAINEAWRKSGKHLRSNLVLRAAPAYAWLREAIRAGDFGDIYAFDGDYLYGRIHKITEGWRRDVQDYSVMLGGGVHLVDLMLWLLGTRPVSVTSMGNRIATQGTAFRYQDFVASTFLFESGLVGRITANFGCVHRHQHVVRVFGTKKTFLHDDSGVRVFSAREDGGRAEPLNLSPIPATKGDLIPDFVHSIRSGADPSPAGAHELNVIAACIAADQALSAHQPTRIAYP